MKYMLYVSIEKKKEILKKKNLEKKKS